jgi:hypothetical protein
LIPPIERIARVEAEEGVKMVLIVEKDVSYCRVFVYNGG